MDSPATSSEATHASDMNILPCRVVREVVNADLHRVSFDYNSSEVLKRPGHHPHATKQTLMVCGESDLVYDKGAQPGGSHVLSALPSRGKSLSTVRGEVSLRYPRMW